MPKRKIETQPNLSRGAVSRWVTVVAGLVCCLTFFIPLTNTLVTLGIATGPSTTSFGPGTSVTYFDSPYNYWKYTAPNLARVGFLWPERLAKLFGLTAIAGLPYFWALCMTVFSLAQLLRMDQLKSISATAGLVAGLVIGGWGFLVAAWGFAYPIRGLFAAGLRDMAWFSAIVLGILTLIGAAMLFYSLRARRHGPWTYLYQGYLAAGYIFAIAVLVFVFEGRIGPDPINGLNMLLAASFLLLVARISEAQAVARVSAWTAAISLLTLRLHRKAPQPGQCPNCRYSLQGLTEQRCPECGRPFTTDDAGIPGEPLAAACEESA
jgi:hypothetical protein